jgi:hypothetical protein
MAPGLPFEKSQENRNASRRSWRCEVKLFEQAVLLRFLKEYLQPA